MKQYFITIIMTLAMAVVAMFATASTGVFLTLTFVKADGSKVSYSVDGLKITYDDYLHAVITNNDTTGTLDLAELDYMYFSNSDTSSITGDVNNDGEVNIADVNTLIDIIQGSTEDNDTAGRADVNADGEISLADINALIDIILTT